MTFQTGDEGDERVKAAYGANDNQLVEVKRRHDPANLSPTNRKIRP